MKNKYNKNKEFYRELLFVVAGLSFFLIFIFFTRFVINVIAMVGVVAFIISIRKTVFEQIGLIPTYLKQFGVFLISLPKKGLDVLKMIPSWLKRSRHKHKYGKKRLNRSKLGDFSLFLFLGGFGLFSAWPLLFIVNNAFKPMDEIFMFPPQLFVKNLTFTNFYDLLIVIGNSWVPFSRYFFNTILITLAGTFGHVIFASMAAYPLAKFKFPGSKFIFNIIVLSLMFAPQVTEIPNYITISSLGLVDSYWAIILPAFAYPLGLYLMKQFMEGIPMSLIEAAKIDGASEFEIFWKVVMPVVKPAWLTLVILVFQQLWVATGGNFIYSEELKTLSYALNQVVTVGIARTGVSAAITLIMMIVPITVFVITQSNIIQTFATSGMKE
ncbi:ABC transporter permease subunit [Turicibacter sanguinis]|uniref:carbohydrate ABC transporter permease n=1 Tax=Turicibacter sanguinis TaxID=154288 RepID=UPI0012BC5F26|nr:carbohydrate ABC transporter permease [Turicibacter sanguinis]MDB8565712.1 carbohydrate ABC transporter permease [Turicibacter sanguinis]MDB8568464.1 carbohydrate ABC transporter permease [Turicibacter sanguinis]MDB8571213.1 carbohydrate ABC transporter permease [Turicibacter sanguinis]MDB8579972.1 carbohydrate ABC transporter permease [Turicibacter sanguinis]MTO08733.1 ABC transporter permease subunit [Turicibacter sanguinis]